MASLINCYYLNINQALQLSCMLVTLCVGKGNERAKTAWSLLSLDY